MKRRLPGFVAAGCAKDGSAVVAAAAAERVRKRRRSMFEMVAQLDVAQVK